MLTEERFASILKILNEKGSVTVNELTKFLNTSESTIRRDLNTLHETGKLKKVHGGATAIEFENEFSSFEEDITTKSQKNIDQKIAICRYAIKLINDNDFIFIDAGTTTENLIPFIENTKATFVTNGIVHAKKLIKKGLKTYILGGQLKLSTEAIIGSECVSCLKKYNFTKSFIGTNGIHIDSGFTTPDIEEAIIKKEAIKKSFVSFILADNSKFGKTSAVTFADLEQAFIITDKLNDKKYSNYTTIKEVDL